MKNFILTLLCLVTFPSLSYAAGSWATVNVSGLVCDFCARAVEKVFSKQDAISHVKVDLGKKTITLQFKDKKNLDDKTIDQLVTDAGYKIVSIIREEGAQ